jgi:hypothetical protein
MHIKETANVNRFVSLRQSPAATPEVMLEELFNLLESYGPTWYTEELHDRAVAALVGRDW